MTGYRFWIEEKEDRNSIVWGAFQSCFLSYKLDKDYYLNHGYMTQVVKKCVEIAFNNIGLHRIEAI